ncbi:MAG: SHOCT domain-containing protein [Alphaproteobacteria bacterium]|nr:SHOCT domain-containing protein [Alphaproteobacteria bacterium]
MRFLPRMIGVLSLSALLAGGVAGTALADGQNGEYGYHMGPGSMWEFGASGMIFHWVMMLVVIGVVAVLLVGAFRAINTTSATQHGGAESAIEVLKKRFARGEIDRAEYDDKLKAMRD